MNNEMIPVPFEELLLETIKEYKEMKSFFGVPVVENKNDTPVGPAAGPHTQLAQNLISAYAAGATVFELKTVQILEGEALGIQKPCIYIGDVVYNTEWSTELTVAEATAEYIKAALLIQVLSKEFELRAFSDLKFVMSVGYDLEGIQSPKVDNFINAMLDARKNSEWDKDIEYLLKNLELFEVFSRNDVDELNPQVTDTVTLSTMHGCPAKDIELIAKYLMVEKGLDTYIKMNPTLLGKERIESILTEKGYELSLPEDIFESDITIDEAERIIGSCLKTAEDLNQFFGVKLTNTLPVEIKKHELWGNRMYMSGPALYALSINTAGLLSELFEGELSMSYSGGIDDNNIQEVLETGIAPITVSSYLLKAGGYKNLSKLLVDYEPIEMINVPKLSELAAKAIEDENYFKKEVRVYKKQEKYSSDCSICHNCEDICPNRANKRLTVNGRTVVIHNRSLCNECGACACLCVMGHIPYLEKTDRIEG